MLNVGAPTVEDASHILIRVLDLHHPLFVEQPLHQYPKQKRSSDSGNDGCKNHTLGSGCTTCMLTITQ